MMFKVQQENFESKVGGSSVIGSHGDLIPEYDSFILARLNGKRQVERHEYKARRLRRSESRLESICCTNIPLSKLHMVE
jgi:hypothetical protein